MSEGNSFGFDPVEEAKKASVDAARVRAWQSMIASDGWKFFVEYVNGKCQERGAMLLEPLSPELNAVERAEHNKGAIYGMQFVLGIPAITVAAYKEQRAASADEDQE